MSFDRTKLVKMAHKGGLNPFGTGQCLSTYQSRVSLPANGLSQSLWNRAMSFDEVMSVLKDIALVSIPLEQGNVFRPLNAFDNIRIAVSQSLWNRAMSFDARNSIVSIHEFVSIPLEQGNVFRHLSCLNFNIFKRLNPFGTGQCLSTSCRRQSF